MINAEEGYRGRLVVAVTDLMRDQGVTTLSARKVQRRMAEILGEAPPYPSVRRWVKEFVQPDDDRVRTAFAAALGVGRDWLFSGNGPKKAPPTNEQLAALTGGRVGEPPHSVSELLDDNGHKKAAPSGTARKRRPGRS